MVTAQIAAKLKGFGIERDSIQSHASQKVDLVLTEETCGVAELFQWVGDSKTESILSKCVKGKRGERNPDVLLFSVRIAIKSEIDLDSALNLIHASNDVEYRENRSRGIYIKYTDLQE